MISRRLVRIKTLQALYAWQQAGSKEPAQGLKMLETTLMAPFEAYLFLLEFPFHFKEFLESEKVLEKSKYFPDKQRIRECGMLSAGPMADELHNAALQYKKSHFRADWTQAADQFDKLFAELREQDFVRDYLVFDRPLPSQEKEFYEELYRYIIQGSETFHYLMEDLYSAWNDDEELLQKEILKTVESADEAGHVRLAPKPKPGNDEFEFGMKVFSLVSGNSEGMEDEIRSITENWDPSRIAVLDLLCIKMALAEFLHFPMIPVKVTINEYLDISRDYSTPGSSRFLNGILDKLRILLEKEGRIQKSGRGLRDR